MKSSKIGFLWKILDLNNWNFFGTAVEIVSLCGQPGTRLEVF